MKRLLLALGLVVLASPAPAQNAITQEGSVLQNSPMMFRGNNRARQGAPVGGAPTGQIVTTGLGISGGICDYSGPTDTAGGYYRLCLDAASGRIVLDGTKNPPMSLTMVINGVTYPFPGGGGGGGGSGIIGQPPTSVGHIAFWNDTSGLALNDRSWKDDGVRLTAPMNRSLTLQGAGGFQLGGPTGPFIMNDTALDTISVQAQPGAGPSGDTTNFQLYPPRIGDKAFINIVAKASPGGVEGEERLLIGSMGAAEPFYHFTQVVTGTGQCRDVIFKDGVSPTETFTMRCGFPSLGFVPALIMGYGVPIASKHPSGSPQSMMFLDTGDNMILGLGGGINNIVFTKRIGSFGQSPSFGSCGTGPVLFAATDTKGLITVGTGTPTTCTVAFNKPYSTSPTVTLTGVNTLGLNFWISDINPTGFTVAAGDGTVSIAGAGIMYHVIQ